MMPMTAIVRAIIQMGQALNRASLPKVEDVAAPEQLVLAG